MKDEFGMPIIDHKAYPPKVIVDYIMKNRRNGEYQEFRITIDANGQGIVHELNRDCETGNFKMKSQTPQP
jgi:hypothetical protein